MDKIRILLSQVYIRLFGKKVRLVNDERFNKTLFLLRTGKRANLNSPKTFNENVLSRKVFCDEYALSVYTDKYEVRKYVADKIGEEYIVPLIGAWEKTDEIDFDVLPDRFVLKATHGSGWNVVVNDKNTLDTQKAIKFLNTSLRSNYYHKSREKNYKNIPPRILCEQFISPKSSKGLIDFKSYCFFGKARFFEITYCENGVQHQTLFYPDLSPVGMKNGHREVAVDDDWLRYKEQIIALAEALASPFEFVRSDFYIADDKIYFSELTFHSGGGIRPILPVSVDYDMGKFFEKSETEK